MKKVKWTEQAPTNLPEGNVKAGDTANLPDMRAAELVGLGWATAEGWEPGELFTPVPMYASSQEPTKATRKAADPPAK